MERIIAKQDVFLRALLFFAFCLITIYVPAKSHIESTEKYQKLQQEYHNYQHAKNQEINSLKKKISFKTKLEDELTQKQLTCLADNIYYEAGHEPYQGKLAVATVTMNRVESKLFPKTVCGVVYQRTKRTCQFSWTCMSRKKKDPSAYAEAKRIAEKVLISNYRSGIITRKAMFYHANYVSPSWASRMHLETVIGAHLFYRNFNNKR